MPKNKHLLNQNVQFLVDIKMGASYESWHHERSEKRLLRLADAVVSLLDKQLAFFESKNLSVETLQCPNEIFLKLHDVMNHIGDLNKYSTKIDHFFPSLHFHFSIFFQKNEKMEI